MSIFQALILGLVQGVTEFLPISSTAHLLLVPRFFGWGEFPLVFDTSLHIGTALAVLVYFASDFLKIDWEMAKKLIIGSAPVIIVGFLLDDFIETYLRATIFISYFLTLGSVVMILADKKAKKLNIPDEMEKSLTFNRSLVVGLAQAFALLPGISRSGITISAGIFTGLDREEAARFSFLLSTPAVLAAGAYKLLTTYPEIQTIGYTPFFLGIAASFVSGLLAIKFMVNFLKTKSLKVFIAYRIALSILILVSLANFVVS